MNGKENQENSQKPGSAMSKKLQVLVVFEFDGIESPDSPEADGLISLVTQLTSLDQTYEDTGASAIWVDDAMIVPGDDFSFSESFADLFKPTKKGV
jgi:hypothetical protein